MSSALRRTATFFPYGDSRSPTTHCAARHSAGRSADAGPPLAGRSGGKAGRPSACVIQGLDKIAEPSGLCILCDLRRAFQAVTRKRKGGNRRVKRVPLPTNQIAQDVAVPAGYRAADNLVRNLSNKRMPRVASPGNVRKDVGTTMAEALSWFARMGSERYAWASERWIGKAASSGKVWWRARRPGGGRSRGITSPTCVNWGVIW